MLASCSISSVLSSGWSEKVHWTTTYAVKVLQNNHGDQDEAVLFFPSIIIIFNFFKCATELFFSDGVYFVLENYRLISSSSLLPGCGKPAASSLFS